MWEMKEIECMSSGSSEINEYRNRSNRVRKKERRKQDLLLALKGNINFVVSCLGSGFHEVISVGHLARYRCHWQRYCYHSCRIRIQSPTGQSTTSLGLG